MPGNMRGYTIRKNMIIFKTLGKVMGPTAYRNKNLEPTVANNVGSKARWNRKLEHPHTPTHTPLGRMSNNMLDSMVRNMCWEDKVGRLSSNMTGSTAESEPQWIHVTMF
jgi:hypothetical protein